MVSPIVSKSVEKGCGDCHVWHEAGSTSVSKGPKPLKPSHTAAEAIDRYIATIVPQKAVSTHRAHTPSHTLKERIGHKRLEDITSSYFSEWRDGPSPRASEHDH
jgi:hypothetical protein